jgi:hypothetical protein
MIRGLSITMGLVFGLWLSLSGGCGAVEAECAAGKACVCEGAGSCEFDCPDGGCSMTCEGLGSCEFSCAGARLRRRVQRPGVVLAGLSWQRLQHVVLGRRLVRDDRLQQGVHAGLRDGGDLRERLQGRDLHAELRAREG